MTTPGPGRTGATRDTGAVRDGHNIYTRHDGKTLACPFVNVFKMRGDKVADYAIHIDNTALFAA